MTITLQIHGRRAFSRCFTVFIVLVLAIPTQVVPAEAQERVQRRNLFEMLFGGGRRYIDDPSVMDVAPRRQRQKQRRRSRASETRSPVRKAVKPPAPAKPPPVAKLDNARQILVVGDFLAAGLGDQLSVAFEESPGVAVTERSNGSSGLVRQDYYNWPQELPGIIDEVNPALVVVLIGANDRQEMQFGGSSEKFRTDAWFTEYERRVQEYANIIRSRQLPLLWVGLPSFQSSSMMTDAIKLNGIYRAQIEKVGGEFVDIWEGFVNEEGKYIATGSDMNGQQARLRGSDGINFTTAGKRKMAFYVEKYARRHLGDMASPELVSLDAASLPELQTFPPSTTTAIPVKPISMMDPDLDGGNELLGAVPPPASAVETPRDMLVKRGELPTPPDGRIDNYQRISIR